MPGRVKCGRTEGDIVQWLNAAGREKTKKWHGRGNSGGSWPPAFPCSYDRAGAWADTAGAGPSQVRTPLTDSGAQLGGARPLA